MAFPDSNWPCGGDGLSVSCLTSKVQVNWKIGSFLRNCEEEKNNLKSDGFTFAGAIWNLFASFGGKEVCSLFGINVRGRSPSDLVLDCCCKIKFVENCGAVKSVIFKFKCGSGDSYCAVEDCLSKLELDSFLKVGYQIDCEIIIKDLKEIANYPDSTWPCGGNDLKVSVYTPEDGCVFWMIKSFLTENLREKYELRSDSFSFAGATWNFFASFDRRNTRSVFGISVREYRSSNTSLDCCCTVTFKKTTLKTMKDIVLKFKCESADSQCTVEDFFSYLSLIEFLEQGAHIVCRISVKKSSVKKAHLQAESQLRESYSAFAAERHSRWTLESRIRGFTDSLLRGSPGSSVAPLLSGSSVSLPGPGVPLPRPGVLLPGFGIQLPGPGVPLPRPGVPLPRPGIPLPRSGIQLPGPSVPLPRPGVPVPGPSVPLPPEPGIQLPRPGIPLPEPGVPFPEPGVPLPRPGVPLPRPGIPLPGPGIQLPRPSIPLPRPGVPLPPEPGIQLPRPGIPLPEPGVPFPEPGVPLPRPGVPLPRPGIPLPGPSIQLPRPSIPLPRPGVPLPPEPGIQLPRPGIPLPEPGVPLPGPGGHNSAPPGYRGSISQGGAGQMRCIVHGGMFTYNSQVCSQFTRMLMQQRQHLPLMQQQQMPNQLQQQRSQHVNMHGSQTPVRPVSQGLHQISAAPSLNQNAPMNYKDEEIPRFSPTFKVCQDIKNLLLSEEGSDVTIQVGDQQFKAHRLVLAARSSVFAAMFRHDTKEKATGVVDVKDCEPSTFPVLLEFLYCGSVEKLSVENMFSVYTAADKYDVQDLKIECLEFIKSNLSIETFCDTVRLSLMHSETNLLKLSINFFARNMKIILMTAKWQSFNIENPDHANEILTMALP